MPSTSIKLFPLWSLCFEKLHLVERIMALNSPRPWQSTEECLHLQSCKLMCKEVSLSQQWLLFWHWHTHTPTHGAVIWHNRSHGADKDGDGILSSPHGWWQSLLQQMRLNLTKAIPSAGRCHLLWQCLSNYIRFGWAINGMSQAIKDFATPAVSQSTIYTFTNWSSVKIVSRKLFKG